MVRRKTVSDLIIIMFYTLDVLEARCHFRTLTISINLENKINAPGETRPEFEQEEMKLKSRVRVKCLPPLRTLFIKLVWTCRLLDSTLHRAFYVKHLASLVLSAGH